MMVTVASRWNVRGYAGLFMWRGNTRLTRLEFEDSESAELYALRLLLRWRGIYANEG